MTEVVVLTPEQLEAIIARAIKAATASAYPPNEEPEILTREQVAKMLQIHPNVVGRYIRELGLPGRKLGGEWRFMREEVRAWLDAQSKGAA